MLHKIPKAFILRPWIHYTKRWNATLSQEKNENLNVIDFFHPSLTSKTINYTFKLGVSGYPKNGNEIESQDDSKYSSIQVGDDAYFQRHDAFGVADGVGGWKNRSGANPALYSKKLMHYAQLELDRIETKNIPQQSIESIDPIKILETAYNSTTLDAKKEGIVGSTTACIAILCVDELRIANIGDCGISVIRKNNYVFRSEEQQHSFNFPYQLGTSSFDTPNDAQQFKVKVEEGDIIILGSDGLFDNLYDDEILEEIKDCVDPQSISGKLVNRAKIVSEDPDNPTSPFQVRAMNEGLYYQGGKADDISVIVAMVKKNSPSEPFLPSKL